MEDLSVGQHTGAGVNSRDRRLVVLLGPTGEVMHHSESHVALPSCRSYFLAKGNILGLVAKSSGNDHEFLDREEWESWGALMMLNRTVVQALDAELRREHGLAVTEFDVLITLFNAPAIALACRRLLTGAAQPSRHHPSGDPPRA